MFNGSFPALITPFDSAGKVDEDAFARLVEWQISQGTHGLVPVGTTGESPTLTEAEHDLAAARQRVREIKSQLEYEDAWHEYVTGPSHRPGEGRGKSLAS